MLRTLIKGTNLLTSDWISRLIISRSTSRDLPNILPVNMTVTSGYSSFIIKSTIASTLKSCLQAFAICTFSKLDLISPTSTINVFCATLQFTLMSISMKETNGYYWGYDDGGSDGGSNETLSATKWIISVAYHSYGGIRPTQKQRCVERFNVH